jgi:hypothetical protein
VLDRCTLCAGQVYSVRRTYVIFVLDRCTLCAGYVYSLCTTGLRCVKDICTLCAGQVYSLYRTGLRCVKDRCTLCAGQVYTMCRISEHKSAHYVYKEDFVYPSLNLKSAEGLKIYLKAEIVYLYWKLSRIHCFSSSTHL